MNAERGVSQDELLAFIEGELAADAAADVECRLGADPELERWAHGVLEDRRALAGLARADALAAPRGIWRDALNEAERRALLVSELGGVQLEEEVEGPYRFRLTPVRLVAAAGFLIVASLGAIAPFLIGPGGGPGSPASRSGGGLAGGSAGEMALPPENALADAGAGEASLEDQIASAGTVEEGLESGVQTQPQLAQAEITDAASSRARSARAGEGDAKLSILEDKSVLAAGYTAAPPPPESRALLASRWAADPNGIIAGRTTPSPLASHAALGWRNLSVMEPQRRPVPGAFPASWGMTPAAAQNLASDHRLAALVETKDPAAYLEGLLQALGRRAAIVSPGIRSDGNGLSAPVEILITAPVDKTERALRLCAIGAEELRLAPLPQGRRLGEWASEALWWADEGAGEGAIRLYVATD